MSQPLPDLDIHPANSASALATPLPAQITTSRNSNVIAHQSTSTSIQGKPSLSLLQQNQKRTSTNPKTHLNKPIPVLPYPQSQFGPNGLNSKPIIKDGPETPHVSAKQVQSSSCEPTPSLPSPSDSPAPPPSTHLAQAQQTSFTNSNVERIVDTDESTTTSSDDDWWSHAYMHEQDQNHNYLGLGLGPTASSVPVSLLFSDFTSSQATVESGMMHYHDSTPASHHGNLTYGGLGYVYDQSHIYPTIRSSDGNVLDFSQSVGGELDEDNASQLTQPDNHIPYPLSFHSPISENARFYSTCMPQSFDYNETEKNGPDRLQQRHNSATSQNSQTPGHPKRHVTRQILLLPILPQSPHQTSQRPRAMTPNFGPMGRLSDQNLRHRSTGNPAATVPSLPIHNPSSVPSSCLGMSSFQLDDCNARKATPTVTSPTQMQKQLLRLAQGAQGDVVMPDSSKQDARCTCGRSQQQNQNQTRHPIVSNNDHSQFNSANNLCPYCLRVLEQNKNGGLQSSAQEQQEQQQQQQQFLNSPNHSSHHNSTTTTTHSANPLKCPPASSTSPSQPQSPTTSIPKFVCVPPEPGVDLSHIGSTGSHHAHNPSHHHPHRSSRLPYTRSQSSVGNPNRIHTHPQEYDGMGPELGHQQHHHHHQYSDQQQHRPFFPPPTHSIRTPPGYSSRIEPRNRIQDSMALYRGSDYNQQYHQPSQQEQQQQQQHRSRRTHSPLSPLQRPSAPATNQILASMTRTGKDGSDERGANQRTGGPVTSLEKLNCSKTNSNPKNNINNSNSNGNNNHLHPDPELSEEEEPDDNNELIHLLYTSGMMGIGDGYGHIMGLHDASCTLLHSNSSSSRNSPHANTHAQTNTHSFNSQTTTIPPYYANHYGMQNYRMGELVSGEDSGSGSGSGSFGPIDLTPAAHDAIPFLNRQPYYAPSPGSGSHYAANVGKSSSSRSYSGHQYRYDKLDSSRHENHVALSTNTSSHGAGAGAGPSAGSGYEGTLLEAMAVDVGALGTTSMGPPATQRPQSHQQQQQQHQPNRPKNPHLPYPPPRHGDSNSSAIVVPLSMGRIPQPSSIRLDNNSPSLRAVAPTPAPTPSSPLISPQPIHSPVLLLSSAANNTIMIDDSPKVSSIGPNKTQTRAKVTTKSPSSPPNPSRAPSKPSTIVSSPITTITSSKNSPKTRSGDLVGTNLSNNANPSSNIRSVDDHLSLSPPLYQPSTMFSAISFMVKLANRNTNNNSTNYSSLSNAHDSNQRKGGPGH